MNKTHGLEDIQSKHHNTTVETKQKGIQTTRLFVFRSAICPSGKKNVSDHSSVASVVSRGWDTLCGGIKRLTTEATPTLPEGLFTSSS